MTSVEIEYCHPCGKLPQAQDVQAAVLEEYGQRLDDVALTVGDGGIFVVRVDGEEIYDSDDEAYDLDALVERVGEHVSAAA